MEKKGDLYCESCWRSFLQINSRLHGIVEEVAIEPNSQGFPAPKPPSPHAASRPCEMLPPPAAEAPLDKEQTGASHVFSSPWLPHSLPDGPSPTSSHAERTLTREPAHDTCELWTLADNTAQGAQSSHSLQIASTAAHDQGATQPESATRTVGADKLAEETRISRQAIGERSAGVKGSNADAPIHGIRSSSPNPPDPCDLTERLHRHGKQGWATQIDLVKTRPDGIAKDPRETPKSVTPQAAPPTMPNLLPPRLIGQSEPQESIAESSQLVIDESDLRTANSNGHSHQPAATQQRQILHTSDHLLHQAAQGWGITPGQSPGISNDSGYCREPLAAPPPVPTESVAQLQQQLHLRLLVLKNLLADYGYNPGKGGPSQLSPDAQRGSLATAQHRQAQAVDSRTYHTISPQGPP